MYAATPPWPTSQSTFPLKPKSVLENASVGLRYVGVSPPGHAFHSSGAPAELEEELDEDEDELSDSELDEEDEELPDSELEEDEDELSDSELDEEDEEVPDSELEEDEDELADSELEEEEEEEDDDIPGPHVGATATRKGVA